MTKLGRDKELLGVALLSGKGGAGKTVIALSMAKVLGEAGIATLLVDADIATHGATYFLQDQLEFKGYDSVLGLDILMDQDPDQMNLSTVNERQLLSTRQGFHFLPSSVRFRVSEVHSGALAALTSAWPEIIRPFEVVLFDCQAGTSPMTEWVLKNSGRTLIVLEPDAISTAALKTLVMTSGDRLPARKTWQVFNKLTPAEREVYEKIHGGMIFTNLPPIPFDWEVRGAFALGRIPGIVGNGTAFGLGILKIMNIIFAFTRIHNELEVLELRTIGGLYEETEERLERLEKERRDRERAVRRPRLVMSAASMTVGVVLVVSSYVYGGPLWWIQVAIMAAVLAFVFALSDRFSVMLAAKGSDMKEVDEEIEKYRTLLITDPLFREYARQRKGLVRTRRDVSSVLKQVPGVRAARVTYDSFGLLKAATLLVDEGVSDDSVISRSRLKLKHALDIELSEGAFRVIRQEEKVR